MTAALEVTTIDVASITAGNATACRCRRTSSTLRPVIGLRCRDEHEARPALRRLRRGGI